MLWGPGSMAYMWSHLLLPPPFSGEVLGASSPASSVSLCLPLPPVGPGFRGQGNSQINQSVVHILSIRTGKVLGTCQDLLLPCKYLMLG